jgi:hypothetical protein
MLDEEDLRCGHCSILAVTIAQTAQPFWRFSDAFIRSCFAMTMSENR